MTPPVLKKAGAHGAPGISFITVNIFTDFDNISISSFSATLQAHS